MNHLSPVPGGAIARSVVAAAVLLVPVASAAVCTETLCSCAGPPGEFILPTGAEIPADSVGIPYWGPVRFVDRAPTPPPAEAFRVERIVDGRTINVGSEVVFVRGPLVGEQYSFDGSNGFVVLVSPRSGFTPGERYVFTYSPRADPGTRATADPYYDDRVVVVVVGNDRLADVAARANAAVLSQTVERSEILRTMTTSGSCSVEIEAAVIDIAIEFPVELSRWSDVLLYSVTVDGELWRPRSSLCSRVLPGDSWVGRGRERLFTHCEPATPGTGYRARPYVDAGAGTHHVAMTAWWPGTETTVSASTTIDLHCQQTRPESQPPQ